MICNKPHSSFKKSKMERIYALLKRSSIQPDNSTANKFQLHFANDHCPYGIFCSDLEMSNQACRRVFTQIAPYLLPLCHSDEDRLYHEVTDLMRGDFSNLFLQLDRERIAYRSKIKFDSQN